MFFFSNPCTICVRTMSSVLFCSIYMHTTCNYNQLCVVQQCINRCSSIVLLFHKSIISAQVFNTSLTYSNNSIVKHSTTTKQTLVSQSLPSPTYFLSRKNTFYTPWEIVHFSIVYSPFSVTTIICNNSIFKTILLSFL